jgi:hypothetical protein
VQDRCRPEELERERFSGVGARLPGEEKEISGQFKFKASTLTHIAELRRTGQEKIENQFIER